MSINKTMNTQQQFMPKQLNLVKYESPQFAKFRGTDQLKQDNLRLIHNFKHQKQNCSNQVSMSSCNIDQDIQALQDLNRPQTSLGGQRPNKILKNQKILDKLPNLCVFDLTNEKVQVFNGFEKNTVNKLKLERKQVVKDKFSCQNIIKNICSRPNLQTY